MEINEYVRTKYGITQYKEYETSKGKLLCMPLINGVFANIEDIIKHSKDIIDLIEEDDYIRIITSSHFDYVYMSYGKLVIRDDVPIENYSNKFIAEVLTKEQIKANAYTIEKEEVSK